MVWKCASFHFHPQCVSLQVKIGDNLKRLWYCEIARQRRWDLDSTWWHPAVTSDLTPLLYLSQNIQTHFEHYWTSHPVSTEEYCTLFRVEDYYYWCTTEDRQTNTWYRQTNTTDTQVSVLGSINKNWMFLARYARTWGRVSNSHTNSRRASNLCRTTHCPDGNNPERRPNAERDLLRQSVFSLTVKMWCVMWCQNTTWQTVDVSRHGF